MSTLSISFPSLPVRSSPQISPPRPWHRGEVHSPVLQIASQPLLGAHGQEEPQRAIVAALTSTAAEVFQAPSSFSCSSRCSFTSRTMAGWSFLKPQNMSRFHRKPTGFPRVLTGHAHMAPWPWPTWPVTLAHTTRDPGTHAPWPRPTWPMILAYTIRDPGPHDPVTPAHTIRDPGPHDPWPWPAALRPPPAPPPACSAHEGLLSSGLIQSRPKSPFCKEAFLELAWGPSLFSVSVPGFRAP